MQEYISCLAPLLTEFVAFKNSLGIEYKTAGHYLKKLDIYNYEHKNVAIPDKELVEGWAAETAARSVSRDRSWIPPVREFGRYLQSRGIMDAYILDSRYSIQHYHAEVYLMTEKEIQLFFMECDRYVLKRPEKGRPYVLPALYRLLYCCGLRCGEARKLKCKEVHLDKGYLDILHSKGHKDRRLYLSEELVEYLKKYETEINHCFPIREYFFPAPHGGMYSESSISANFRNIWISAGLNRNGKVKPRAYDFRHHFACANIMKWSEEGLDIHAMLPYLMRYMGHSGLESTYYYIHLIPDYFPKYTTITLSTEDLLPEVVEYEV